MKNGLVGRPKDPPQRRSRRIGARGKQDFTAIRPSFSAENVELGGKRWRLDWTRWGSLPSVAHIIFPIRGVSRILTFSRERVRDNTFHQGFSRFQWRERLRRSLRDLRGSRPHIGARGKQDFTPIRPSFSAKNVELGGNSTARRTLSPAAGKIPLPPKKDVVRFVLSGKRCYAACDRN